MAGALALIDSSSISQTDKARSCAYSVAKKAGPQGRAGSRNKIVLPDKLLLCGSDHQSLSGHTKALLLVYRMPRGWLLVFHSERRGVFASIHPELHCACA